MKTARSEADKRSPVVRTNPVTGWKSLFGAGHQIHAGWIDNVTETESEVIKAYCEYSLLATALFRVTNQFPKFLS